MTTEFIITVKQLVTFRLCYVISSPLLGLSLLNSLHRRLFSHTYWGICSIKLDHVEQISNFPRIWYCYFSKEDSSTLLFKGRNNCFSYPFCWFYWQCNFQHFNGSKIKILLCLDVIYKFLVETLLMPELSWHLQSGVC